MSKNEITKSRLAVTSKNRVKEDPSLFIHECALKLQFKPLTYASAAIIYHTFFNEFKDSDYDKHLLGASALYLSAKIKDDPVKLRDIINVVYSTLHPERPTLDLGEEYWSLRDAILQSELLIARSMKFNFNITHPHRYLLYYLHTLRNWLGTEVWNSVPLSRAAMCYLQDFHQSPKILKHKGEHIAVCCITLALQTYGVQVPMVKESSDDKMWFSPLLGDMTKEKLWEILDEIMEFYSRQD